MSPVLSAIFESWIPKACGALGSLESEQYKSLFLSIGGPIKSKREGGERFKMAAE